MGTAAGGFRDAEQYYRRCFQAWEGLPGNRLLWKANVGFCLWQLGKLEEGNKFLATALKDRWDTSSMRPGKALFALGNTEMSQAEKPNAAGDVKVAEIIFEAAVPVAHAGPL